MLAVAQGICESLGKLMFVITVSCDASFSQAFSWAAGKPFSFAGLAP